MGVFVWHPQTARAYIADGLEAGRLRHFATTCRNAEPHLVLTLAVRGLSPRLRNGSSQVPSMSDIYPPPHLRISPHPVQTVLTSFAGAYFVAALVTDIAYWKSANMMWANFSSWMLVAGLVVGGFALLATLVNAIRRRHPETRRPAWLVFLGLLVV